MVKFSVTTMCFLTLLHAQKKVHLPCFCSRCTLVCVFVCCSEAAAHAVATLAEATLQGGGQIVLAETAAAVGALAGVQDATGTYTFM